MTSSNSLLHWPTGKIRTPTIRSGSISAGGDEPLLLIAGPCVIESEDILYRIAEELLNSIRGLPFRLVFKASYDKANRTSHDSFRGPGIGEGLRLLQQVRERFGVPITSDVHTPQEAEVAGRVLDVVQIPALLCRQNDLIAAAAKSGRLINIKKGQFLAPEDMLHRVRAAGTGEVIVTERGTCFGYHNLVNDFRALVIMRSLGLVTIFDATHSVQKPGAAGKCSGGERSFVPALARAAAAVGVDGFFFEVHPDPDRALCDGPNSLPLQALRPLLEDLAAIDGLLRNR